MGSAPWLSFSIGWLRIEDATRLAKPVNSPDQQTLSESFVTSVLRDSREGRPGGLPACDQPFRQAKQLPGLLEPGADDDRTIRRNPSRRSPWPLVVRRPALFSPVQPWHSRSARHGRLHLSDWRGSLALPDTPTSSQLRFRISLYGEIWPTDTPENPLQVSGN